MTPDTTTIRTQVSPAWGFAQTRKLWRLVLAAWLVPALLLLVPFLAIVRAMAPWFEHMPVDGTAPGDVALVGFWALGRLGGVVGLLAVGALVLAWFWTILWHAGVTGWYGLGGGRTFRLGEMVGLGVLRWFRYLRLALAGLVGTGVLAAVLASPFFVLAKKAGKAMEETRMVNLQLAGMIVAALVIWLCWIGILRGAWELAAPGRRSAVMAWLRGLRGAVTDLPRSLGTVILWGVFLKGFTLLPLLAGIRFSGFGGTPGWFALAVVSHLAAAFSLVGLFLSFAPVSGLIVERGGEAPAPAPGGGTAAKAAPSPTAAAPDVPPGAPVPGTEVDDRQDGFEDLFELDRR